MAETLDDIKHSCDSLIHLILAKKNCNFVEFTYTAEAEDKLPSHFFNAKDAEEFGKVLLNNIFYGFKNIYKEEFMKDIGIDKKEFRISFNKDKNKGLVRVSFHTPKPEDLPEEINPDKMEAND